MRSIYLIRHAAAVAQSSSDFTRDLSLTGLGEADYMGHWLASKNARFDRFFASSAHRSAQTAEKIAQILNFPTEQIVYDRSIYHGGIDGIIEIIKALPTDCQTFALVGHNPTISDLSHQLSDQKVFYLANCAAVHIDIDIDDWSAFSPRKCRFIEIHKP